MADKTTHFGFRNVPVTEKTRHVREVFDSVADNYDLMNDLMSFGIHRLWKRFAINMAGLKPGQQVLDLAGGTGDLTRLMAPAVGPSGYIVLSDINAEAGEDETASVASGTPRGTARRACCEGGCRFTPKTIEHLRLRIWPWGIRWPGSPTAV